MLLAVTNAMFLTPGPDGSIIVKEGDNRSDHLGKLWFPAQERFIPIEPELFGDEDPDQIRSIHWLESRARFVACTRERIWSIPIDAVLSQQRYRADNGRKIKS